MELLTEFNLIFRGEIADNYDELTTKQIISKTLNVSDEKIAQLFSGRPAIIKKGLSSEKGLKLQQQMLNIGAITYLEPINVSKKELPLPTKLIKTSPASISHQSKKVILALDPIDTPSQSANNIQEHLLNEEDTQQAKFNAPKINFSLRILIAIFFLLLGITCLVVFSPYGDHVIRKGFAVGACIVFMAYRKLKH